MSVKVTPGSPILNRDALTNTQVGIDYAHYAMHMGEHYFFKNWQDIEGADTVVYVLLRTPESPTRIHAKAAIDSEAEFLIELFEDSTVSADGTPITIFNNDRESTNTSEASVFAAPTVTDDGSLLWAGKTGTGRNPIGTSPGLNYEVLPKASTDYLLKITKATSGIHWVDFDFWWYEHIHS